MALSLPVYTYQCSQDFTLKGVCGYYLEVHRPLDESIIERFKIDNVEPAGTLIFANLVTNSLCAGKYHIWLVAMTRNGAFIEHVKPVYILDPPCTDALIKSLGF